MYATKRLRGLLALWLVLILVFGLGTTVYAAEYKIPGTTNPTTPVGLKDSDGNAPSNGYLYPKDTVFPEGSGYILIVYYSDGVDSFYGDEGATHYVSDGITEKEIGYYQSEHKVLSKYTSYTYTIEEAVNHKGSTSETGGVRDYHTPVYQLTLTGVGDPVPSIPPSPDPAPPPSPEPAPAPIRCDLPVLFDPIGPVDKYGGAGGSVTMSVSARDALRFQWQVNRNDGTGWHEVEGAVTDTYTLENLDAIHEGWQFRAVVRNNCGPVISPNFTVHVHVPVAEVPETGGPGAALAALGLVSLGAGLGIARKRRG